MSWPIIEIRRRSLLHYSYSSFLLFRDAAAATSLHGGGGGGGGGDFEGGGPEWCHYCEEYLRPREALAGHRCEVLRCRKCNKHYTYREVFKKHVDGCVG